jgi:NAD(P)H-flavin reductase
MYEKYWDAENFGKSASTANLRIEEESEYSIRKKIGEHTYIIEFEISPPFAVELEKTGAFVFLRYPQDPVYFNFPVGIMKVIGNRIQAAVEAVGPKSAKLFMNPDHKLLVRGPYYNGVLGYPWIDNLRDGKIILVAGGIGQAPAVPLAAKLSYHNKEIKALLAPGKMGEIFIEEDLRNYGIEAVIVPSLRKNGTELLQEWLRYGPDLVVSAGPDAQHYHILELMSRLQISLPMAVTNNATMCCGEGICGSCRKKTKNNEVIRLCKTQIDFRDIVEE